MGSLQNTHRVAAFVAAATLAAYSAANAGGWRALPAPFAWLDVAVVCFLAALPLAASVVSGVLMRLPLSKSTLAIIAVELAALLVVPHIYIRARCRRDLKEAVQLATDMRYREARDLLHRIVLLLPRATWNGAHVAAWRQRMDAAVQQIAATIAEPLAPNASEDVRVRRAEFLAMLGQTAEALSLLTSSPALSTSPQACNLRATVYETRHDWQTARAWYARARSALRHDAISAESQTALRRSVTGVAYCERKLGRLQQADAAWQELLALEPTADTHFLLAQFYEDTQQSAKARLHARAAATAAPQRYAIAARQLEDKLVTSHFGCLGIVTSEWSESPMPNEHNARLITEEQPQRTPLVP